MKIAVVGCGAMGSVYAGLLAAAGNEVLAVDPWPAHVDAINAGGLRVEGKSGDRTARIRAMTVASREPVDLAIIAAKALTVESSAASALPLLGPDTVVLTIQNGLGSADVVAGVVGAGRLAVGIAGGFGAKLVGPGHAFHNGMELVRIGAYGSLARERVERVVAVWHDAGFHAELESDVPKLQWEKLICNVAYSGPCVLIAGTIGEVMADPDAARISGLAAAEAAAVGLARGIKLEIGDPVKYIRAFGSKIPNAKPSLLLDHEIRRRSEIDFINGAIPREAAKAGLDAPINTTITAFVKARERDFAA
jgi:2-dehydropantoate 2-reductase